SPAPTTAASTTRADATPVKPAQYRGNLGGCGKHDADLDETPHAARVINDREERALLGDKQAPGRLIDLAPGDGAHGTTIVVHGMNSGPSSAQPISDYAATHGEAVKAFIYNDQYQSISDSGRHLADAIDAWRTENPGKPLDLRSHSLGTRVALSALQHLQEDGRIEGPPIRHVMFGPPLEGMRAANGVRWAPRALDGRFPGVSPGRQMRPDSNFQKMISHLTMPDNVDTTIVAGGQDTIVDATSPGFERIAQHLHAKVIHIPQADHHTVVDHPYAADGR
ncbi:MAG: alpha/beta hydrolase, partial [Proteobacteria bacterium]|nr:alpha/beta hydrolase [Pseudomonadota bacterium]